MSDIEKKTEDTENEHKTSMTLEHKRIVCQAIFDWLVRQKVETKKIESHPPQSS